MQTYLFLVVTALISGLSMTPALGFFVVYEDFEDDTPTNFVGYDAPGLDGPPTNTGRPGTWIPNQYDQLDWFNNPWFDDLDTDPDTNWQLQVTSDIGPDRAGNEAFFQNQHTSAPLYIHWSGMQQDCATSGQTQPGPCNVARFSRDGFLEFSLADGTRRPAMPGETLKVSFDFTFFDGIPVFALTNDVHQMAADTADETLHEPLTKWTVGFGQPFNPLDEGLEAWFNGSPQHPNVVSLLAMTNNFNQRAFDVRIPNPNQPDVDQKVIALDPDFVEPIFQQDPDDPDGNDYPYATLAFEYTVGESNFDVMTIDKHDGNGAQVVQQEQGGLVPIGRPGVTTTGIDGIVFSDTGTKQAAYMLDNIFIEILTGAAPLPGDANNDNLVTGADLITVQQNFGNVDANSPTDGLFLGDANDDGLVTGADLITVQQNFGNVAASPIAVPEPTAMLISCIGLLALCRRGRPGT